MYKYVFHPKRRTFLHRKCMFQVVYREPYGNANIPIPRNQFLNRSNNNVEKLSEYVQVALNKQCDCINKTKVKININGNNYVNRFYLNNSGKTTVRQNELLSYNLSILNNKNNLPNGSFLNTSNSSLPSLIYSTILRNNTIFNAGQLRLKSTKVQQNLQSSEIESENLRSIEGKDITNDTPPITASSGKIKEIYFADDDKSKQILKLHPAPKSVLNNFYSVLSQEQKKPLKLTPNYKSIKDNNSSVWVCMYHIQWPEEIKFLGKDPKKKLASHKAATAALTWLNSSGKVSKEGLPIIYEKHEVKQLARKTIPALFLDKNTVEDMRNIVNLFEGEIAPHIANALKSGDEVDSKVEDQSTVMREPSDVILKSKRQRYLGLTQYLAKEKVELPIAAHKESFIQLLKDNQIVIVKGEPGCGKSTRIPQYVLEAWAKEDGFLGQPCRVAVTQPRRIAAISLAERVASERDENVGEVVGYQVRLRSNFRPVTGRILYCTTGILLRHLQSDPNLSNFTHVILDEAHERDVNVDLLMNLLRSAIKSNPKLKLIVMSATIDTKMFSEYFGGAPIMEIPGFTYPVKQHFLDSLKNIDVSKTLKMCNSDAIAVEHEEVVKVIEYIRKNKKEGAILCFLPGWEDISRIQRMIPTRGDVAVYCLHSRLQDSEQWKIFSRPPPGVRKIILATNIAETSVTIDDVVYVIDTGIHKEKRFDVDRGINCIDNHWISQASANQRKGRAGRVQPGESFHLYPSSKFQTFPKYSDPEFLRTSLTKIVLDTKVFSNNMNAVEFMRKLPTPPDENATLKAVDELKDLELLDDKENLTTLGRTVADFQLEPKLSKAMVNAVIFNCVTPIVDIVTLFSAETEFFVSGLLDKREVQSTKRQFCGNSDHLAMMRVFEKWLEYAEGGDMYTLNRFCNDTNLMPYKMQTIEKLRRIHFDYLYKGLRNIMPISDSYSDNDELVKAVLFSGVSTVLQHRNWDIVKNRLKNNVNVLLTRNNHKATITSESVNFKRSKYPTNFLVYINETRSNIRRTTLVRECSLISSISVLLFSNKKLEIINASKESVSSSIPSEDQVNVRLENTNIEVLCDRAQAQELVKCKDAVMTAYRYYIHQLTNLGNHSSEVNNAWDNVLALINDILRRNSV